MSKFQVEKKLNLGFLGQNWEQAEIVFSGLTFTQAKELSKVDFENSDDEKSTNFVESFIKEHFIRGTAWNGTQLVNLTADDLSELPVEVINKATEILVGTPNPKS